MFEIFKTLRKLGTNVTSESFIKFEAPECSFYSNYCTNSSIEGGPITSIIDDNISTAWATTQNEDPTKQYVIMEFIQQPVYIHTLYFYSLCGPPMELIIQGSNDHNSWETIGIRDQPIPINAITAIPCFERKFYKYFKLNQTKNTGTNANKTFRFHIHQIEIYGLLGNMFRETSQQKMYILNSCMFFIMITMGSYKYY